MPWDKKKMRMIPLATDAIPLDHDITVSSFEIRLSSSRTKMSSETPKRTFTGSDLIPGKTYRVIAEFIDYDGLTHPVGETWKFVAKDFLPYDDGLTLYTEHGGKSGVFRLQWRTETQGHIISSFSDFVEEL